MSDPSLSTGADPEAVLPTGLLIGDAWVDTTSAGEMEHVYAATGEVQRSFPVAGPAEIDAAVAAARAALAAWARIAPAERRAVLLRIAAALRAHAAEFATISVLEAGMIRPAAASMAGVAAEWFDYYGGWADKLGGDHIRMPGAFDYTVPEPVGVAAVLFTWNGPTASLGMKVAPALAAGCTVVLKPPELAPFSSNLFARLCLDAGLPPGVLNVVPGGPAAGEALVRHPGIDKISFTGGRATAVRIQQACAETLTPLLLELGGKSANIVFDDANLAAAATASAVRVVGMTGQTCVAPTRLLVQSTVYDEVVDRVVAIMGSVRIGDPLAADTTMGPVINAAARDRIAAVVSDAAARGDGKLLLGGEALPDGLPGGFFVTPAAFADVDHRTPLACNEIFGPVLSISRFDDEDEAVAVANDTPYGLAAYLHTTNLARAHRVAGALDAGNVAVNGGAPMAGPYAPFGGFKGSGHGKEGALAGLLEFVRVKNVNINLGA